MKKPTPYAFSPGSSRICAVAALVLASFGLAPAPALSASGNVQFGGTVVGGPATALEPMSSSVVSFSDRAAFQVKSVNREPGHVTVRLRAYGDGAAPLNAVVYPREIRLAPGNSAISTVIVPLPDQAISQFRICAVHTDRAGSEAVRACGQYSARKIVLSE